MPRVTVSSVSANNIQTWFFVHSLHITAREWPPCKTSRPNSKVTGTQGLPLSGTVQGQEWLALRRCWNSQ